jgi:hypothetical protein
VGHDLSGKKRKNGDFTMLVEPPVLPKSDPEAEEAARAQKRSRLKRERLSRSLRRLAWVGVFAAVAYGAGQLFFHYHGARVDQSLRNFRNWFYPK